MSGSIGKRSVRERHWHSREKLRNLSQKKTGKEDEAEEIATEETVAENAEVETAEVETDTNEVEAVEESSEGAGEEDSSGWFDSLFSDDEEE
jgi:hypothetical protein